MARRLREHVEDPTKLPILIFPEGTCINNTVVMQFKKGSFEVGGVIYPVAIKYDPKFGDAFWNSSRHSIVQYLLRMMTSWAIVVDVWYLPPMTIQQVIIVSRKIFLHSNIFSGRILNRFCRKSEA